MSSAADMWALAVAVIVVVAPGWALLLALGVRRPSWWIGLAPPASVGVATITAMGCAVLGVRYGPVALGAVTGGLLTTAAVRSGRPFWRRATRDVEVPTARTYGDLVPGAVLVAAGVGLGVLVWTHGLGSMATVGQEHDLIVHGVLTAYIQESGHGAPWQLLPADVLTGRGVTFYPAGLHLLMAATGALAGGTVVGINAVSAVVLGAGWTSGSATLAHVAARRARLDPALALVAAGAAAIVAAGLYRPTIALVQWGGTVPNAATLALTPGLLAALVTLPSVGRPNAATTPTASTRPGLPSGAGATPTASTRPGLPSGAATTPTASTRPGLPSGAATTRAASTRPVVPSGAGATPAPDARAVVPSGAGAGAVQATAIPTVVPSGGGAVLAADAHSGVSPGADATLATDTCAVVPSWAGDVPATNARAVVPSGAGAGASAVQATTIPTVVPSGAGAVLAADAHSGVRSGADAALATGTCAVVLSWAGDVPATDARAVVPSWAGGVPAADSRAGVSSCAGDVAAASAGAVAAGVTGSWGPGWARRSLDGQVVVARRAGRVGPPTAVPARRMPRLAAGLALLGRGVQRAVARCRVGPGVALGVAVAGMVAIHPSAVVTGAVSVLAWWAGEALGADGRRRLLASVVPLLVAGVVAAAVAAPLLLAMARLASHISAFAPDIDPIAAGDALDRTLRMTYNAGDPRQKLAASQVVAGAAALAGAAILVVGRRALGAVTAWLVWVALVTAAWVRPGEGVPGKLTHVFYDAQARVWSHASLFVPTLAGLGLAVVAAFVGDRTRRAWADRPDRSRLLRGVAPAVGTVLALAYLAGPGYRYCRTDVEALASRYARPDYTRVSSADRRAGEWLAERIAPGERVLNSANDGSTLLYVDRRLPIVNVASLGSAAEPATYRLLQGFNRYPDDADVRRMLRELDVRWVYVDTSAPTVSASGAPFAWAGRWLSVPSGLRHLSGLPGLERRYRSGSVSIYHLDPAAIVEPTGPAGLAGPGTRAGEGLLSP